MTDLLNREIEMKHPHAEFLRAIADDPADLENWHCSAIAWPQGSFRDAIVHVEGIFLHPNGWKVWRKPKTIKYEVEIPEPLTEAPEDGTSVYWIDASGATNSEYWEGKTLHSKRLLKNRQLFDTADKARTAFNQRMGLGKGDD